MRRTRVADRLQSPMWCCVGSGLVAAAFMVALWLPLFGTLRGWSECVRIEERRKLAPRPTLSRATLGAYPEAVCTYFADHFAGRISLAYVYSLVKVKLFHHSPSKQVLIGRDNWLFFTGSRKIEDFQGLCAPDGATCRRWQHTLRERDAWLRARGAQYLFLQVPNKVTIYPEYMPTSIHRKGAATRLDVLAPFLAASGVDCYVDLRPALRAARRDERVYYEAGTHWNHIGAFAAYTALAQRLHAMMPDLTPIPRERFRSALAPGESICHMLCIRDEDLGIPLSPRLELAGAQATRIPIEPPADYPSPHPSLFSTESPEGIGTLLVIHDSFLVDFMRRVLPEHFARTIWVRNNGNFDHARLAALVDAYRPTVVIEERVERFMIMTPDDASLPPAVGR